MCAQKNYFYFSKNISFFNKSPKIIYIFHKKNICAMSQKIIFISQKKNKCLQYVSKKLFLLTFQKKKLLFTTNIQKKF